MSSGKEITFEAGAEETKEFTATFDVPLGATDDTLIITIARVANPNANNHAVVEPIILSRH